MNIKIPPVIRSIDSSIAELKTQKKLFNRLAAMREAANRAAMD